MLLRNSILLPWVYIESQFCGLVFRNVFDPPLDIPGILGNRRVTCALNRYEVLGDRRRGNPDAWKRDSIGAATKGTITGYCDKGCYKGLSYGVLQGLALALRES